ncbi:MAG: tRNA pseudouridine(55) synthase TruB [Limnohabitans sp.]|nr:tRNA pseudouridine(55) synthase TruB [Limnohabitans sp.]
MNAPRTRVQRRPVHGVLLLDKPLGLSSNQALQKVKWLLRAEKAGHTGTLDPLATGVLPLCFGAATKFSQLHLDAEKTYEAIARLGIRTSTADAEGDVISTQEVNVTTADIQRVEQKFTGPIEQIPPMHSALKKDGKALYEYARLGIEIERPARHIVIHQLQLEEIDAKDGQRFLKMVVHCSKGTYIRTLAEDIGIALGCGAHLTQLRRIATGSFQIGQCIGLEQLESEDDQQRAQHIQPVKSLVAGHHTVTLSSADAGCFLSGVRRRGSWPDHDQVAVYGSEPRAFLGTAHIRAGELIPERLLNPHEIQSIFY